MSTFIHLWVHIRLWLYLFVCVCLCVCVCVWESLCLQGDKANSVWAPRSHGSSCVLLVDECVCEVNDAAEQHESLFETRTHARTKTHSGYLYSFLPTMQSPGSGDTVGEVSGTPVSRSSPGSVYRSCTKQQEQPETDRLGWSQWTSQRTWCPFKLQSKSFRYEVWTLESRLSMAHSILENLLNLYLQYLWGFFAK